jgi:hypothetical protein
MVRMAKTLRVATSDGQLIPVSHDIILMMGTLQNQLCDIENNNDENEVEPDEITLIAGVDSVSFAKCVEYCNNHVEEFIQHLKLECDKVRLARESQNNGKESEYKPVKINHRKSEMSSVDIEFCKANINEIESLAIAASFLDIKGMLYICTKTISDSCKGLSTEELRKKFGIVNDFTPEEEAAIRNEHSWLFT